MTLDPDVNDRKFEYCAGPTGATRHLTGPAGVGLGLAHLGPGGLCVLQCIMYCVGTCG
jgi:hypothetical protein